MFCSTIIPTIGRSTLIRAVQSILDQNFQDDDFEIIVVNDSGSPLAPAAWQQSEKVRVLNTNRHERCVARNAGAAIAKGDYLHFLDDDDWLLPDALNNFWLLAKKHKDAHWLYGSAIFSDSVGQDFNEVNLKLSGNCFVQVVAGVWIPLQASFIKNEAFFAVGGFQSFSLIVSSEDIDLSRRIALIGEFAHSQTPVAGILRGPAWETSTNEMKSIEGNRVTRDNILNEIGAFTRMRQSANDSFWYGRLVHAYITAMIFNLRKKKLFSAISRALFGIISLISAGRHIFSARFWQALRTEYITIHHELINDSEGKS